MVKALTAQGLFDALGERLELKWAAAMDGGSREVKLIAGRLGGFGSATVGFLNLIRTNQIQVLGTAELAYIEELSAPVRDETLRRLCGDAVIAIVVGDDRPASSALLDAAAQNQVPLWLSPATGEQIVENMQLFLADNDSQRETLHGVFMEVMGIGVLLSGSSGVGKSELALELITRGHRLIADDAPEFTRVMPNGIRGACPKPLQDFLEVRGLGILDIRAMFGDNAIKHSESLQLTVRLKRMVENEVSKMDRLQGDTRMVKVLGVDVPEITVPVLMGGHLAVVVEGAVRNHLLLKTGYNASEEFISRQKRIMTQGEA